MSDIDDIMDKDPLGLTDQDLDAIILYQRKHQANVELGKKISKGQTPKLGQIDLVKLGLVKAAPKITRRF